MRKKRILVDLSFTLPHHGHMRLLKQAKKLGKVIVGLTTDKEVLKYKGYVPELNYDQRKEILQSIKYVDEIIPSDWLVTNDYLEKNNIDYLFHGQDNSNPVNPKKLIIARRTKYISSNIIRRKAYKNHKKLIQK